MTMFKNIQTGQAPSITTFEGRQDLPLRFRDHKVSLPYGANLRGFDEKNSFWRRQKCT
jgi:hypothetical protein